MGLWLQEGNLNFVLAKSIWWHVGVGVRSAANLTMVWGHRVSELKSSVEMRTESLHDLHVFLLIKL